MAIVTEHIPYYRELFALPGFLQDPVVIIGVQEIFGMQPEWPQLSWETRNATVRDLLLTLGLKSVMELDFYDKRANIIWDLNLPIPIEWHGTAKTLIDIGSIEHVADTMQVLKNYLNLVAIGGRIFIHTPIKGYFKHGLHTFSPELLPETLTANGCEIIWYRESTDEGVPLEAIRDVLGDDWVSKMSDLLQWIVVRKKETVATFTAIQQAGYR